MRIWFHKIPFYHLNKRILWKLYLLYTDYLISQKYKKWSPGKYAMLLYVAVSIRWISIRFDALFSSYRFELFPLFKSCAIVFIRTIKYTSFARRCPGNCFWILKKKINFEKKSILKKSANLVQPFFQRLMTYIYERWVLLYRLIRTTNVSIRTI